MSALRLMLLTVGGLGLIRRAPGTCGSLPPVIMTILLAHQFAASTLNVTLGAVALCFAIICLTLTPWGEKRFGRKDAGAIVADEVVGMSIALLFLPWRTGEDNGSVLFNVGLALIACAAFRLFDIWKPPPVRQVQVWPAGWGVLADDVVAGLYALAVVQTAARWVL